MSSYALTALNKMT